MGASSIDGMWFRYKGFIKGFLLPPDSIAIWGNQLPNLVEDSLDKALTPLFEPCNGLQTFCEPNQKSFTVVSLKCLHTSATTEAAVHLGLFCWFSSPLGQARPIVVLLQLRVLLNHCCASGFSWLVTMTDTSDHSSEQPPLHWPTSDCMSPSSINPITKHFSVLNSPAQIFNMQWTWVSPFALFICPVGIWRSVCLQHVTGTWTLSHSELYFIPRDCFCFFVLD